MGLLKFSFLADLWAFEFKILAILAKKNKAPQKSAKFQNFKNPHRLVIDIYHMQALSGLKNQKTAKNGIFSINMGCQISTVWSWKVVDPILKTRNMAIT